MTTCLVAFAVAFVVAALTTPVVRATAKRLGVVDKPDRFRKVHEAETPLLGGVAIYVAFAAPVLALGTVYRNDVPEMLYAVPVEAFGLLAAAGIALCLGIADDAFGVSVGWKLLFQFVAASVAFASGYSISAVSNPFGDPVTLGVLSFPVTVVWFMICMNAVNLLDGLDGLAAGVCIFAVITLFLVSLFFGNVVAMALLACLGGAILGFLVYNFHPASIFLGDSGSLLLGFLVAALALVGAARKVEATVALLVPLMALGLPIFDMTLAVLRRWLRRLPISAADRQHIHHKLLSLGISHRHAVLILYGVCVICGGGALLLTLGRDEVTLMVLGSVTILAFVSIRLSGQVQFSAFFDRFFTDWDRQKSNSRAKLAVEKAVHHMQQAESVDAAWEAVTPVFPLLGLDSAWLRVGNGACGEGRCFVWHRVGSPLESADPLRCEGWIARLGLRSPDGPLGEFLVAKASANGPVMPVAPELVNRLWREMNEQIARLAPSEVLHGAADTWWPEPVRGTAVEDDATVSPGPNAGSS